MTLEETRSQTPAQALQPIILADQLSRHYTAYGQTIKAVDAISFQLLPHQLSAICGKSGSGKSTLLYLLGCLDKPTSGTVVLDGVDVTTLHGHAENEFRRTRVGFVFQFFHLVPNLSAVENVLLPMELAGKALRPSRERARDLLELVGIDRAHQQHRPAKLSGGQQQRVAIARALANDPAVLLADEPTGNLDRETGLHILEVFHHLVELGRTVVVVTHDEQIASRAEMVLSLEDGHLVS
jgi:putative ABC transport system ATP-binding protein